MKLCKDCKWISVGRLLWRRHWDDARCRKLPDRYSAKKFVVGIDRLEHDDFQICGWARCEYGECGPDGKLWEPKEGKVS